VRPEVEPAATTSEDGQQQQDQQQSEPEYLYGEQEFVRTGLLGFLGPVNHTFNNIIITYSINDLGRLGLRLRQPRRLDERHGKETQHGRRHRNSAGRRTHEVHLQVINDLRTVDELVIDRGRIAVFSIKVLRDERICVVAEQRPDCTEEEVKETPNYTYTENIKALKTLYRMMTHYFFPELPMDVSRASSGGFHPPSWHLLHRASAAQPSAQDATGRNSLV